MRNIDLYSSGRSGLLGGQVARIPSYTAKPYDIITPASARYTFGADMIRALTAKAEKDKEDKIRTDMLGMNTIQARRQNPLHRRHLWSLIALPWLMLRRSPKA